MTEPTATTDLVWGTGYGSKRHLIEPGTRRQYGQVRQPQARAACSWTTWLSTFSDDTPFVMSKVACSSCAKRAALKVCPTCSGAGVVAE